MVFSESPAHAADFSIEITNLNLGPEKENYTVALTPDGKRLTVTGSNELGTIFGIYRIARDLLGIAPFYAWTDFTPRQLKTVEISNYHYVSPAPKMRFRGWFINGEDCLIGMSGGHAVRMDIWEKIFETVLRSENNMVCPGTFCRNASSLHQLAGQMGVWITHHHAEPLGAPLFSYIHPDLQPHFYRQKKRFEKIYRDTIRWNKKHDIKVVYGLGFRGQGDGPFWKEMPEFKTIAARRRCIADVVRFQWNILREETGQDCPPAVFHLYGEQFMLFHNCLEFIPEGVILCWSDNGYGAMRVRRAPFTDENIASLPARKIERSQGVYYHINFHDLQASNQLTMLVRPTLMLREYQRMAKRGVADYSICNAGNIRPHVYELDLLARYTAGAFRSTGIRAQMDEHARDFFGLHFPSLPQRVYAAYRRYFEIPFRYGKQNDQVVGDEFYNFYLRRRIVDALNLSHAPIRPYFKKHLSPAERDRWVMRKAARVQAQWDNLLTECDSIIGKLFVQERPFFRANLRLQTIICGQANRALRIGLQACQLFATGKFVECFVAADQGLRMIEKILAEMDYCQKGVWHGFYSGDFCCNIRATRRMLTILREIARVITDSIPTFITSAYANARSFKPNFSDTITRFYRDDSRQLAKTIEGLLPDN